MSSSLSETPASESSVQNEPEGGPLASDDNSEELSFFASILRFFQRIAKWLEKRPESEEKETAAEPTGNVTLEVPVKTDETAVKEVDKLSEKLQTKSEKTDETAIDSKSVVSTDTATEPKSSEKMHSPETSGNEKVDKNEPEKTESDVVVPPVKAVESKVEVQSDVEKTAAPITVDEQPKESVAKAEKPTEIASPDEVKPDEQKPIDTRTVEQTPIAVQSETTKEAEPKPEEAKLDTISLASTAEASYDKESLSSSEEK